MIVAQTGNYKLLNDIKTRNSTSIGMLPKGTVLEITQIDSAYHKVVGPKLFDWIYWDLPVEPACPLDLTRPENYPCSRGDCDCEICKEQEKEE